MERTWNWVREQLAMRGERGRTVSDLLLVSGRPRGVTVERVRACIALHEGRGEVRGHADGGSVYYRLVSAAARAAR